MVTPDDIAIELGRPTPVPDPTREQWETWIARAVRAIRRRAERLGIDPDGLDPDDIDEVVVYAVARRATRPADGAESTTDQISVDDGSVNRTRRYPNGLGDIHILDEWWKILGLVLPDGGWSGSVTYSRGR